MSTGKRRKAGNDAVGARTNEGVEGQNGREPTPDENGRLPRPVRRRRKAKADRGLPADAELADLARAYLERQRRLWFKLVEAGFLSEPTDENIAAMVQNFKERHRTGKVDLATIRPLVDFGLTLAGNYDRYSCDNSNPKSVLDQMSNCLDRAQEHERFVPWAYVFADYSITGLTTARQGYAAFKKLLADSDHFIDTTFIDDFTRASRDEIEWWKLAHLAKRLKKRMIGASDGFDLGSPDWDLKITMYGLLSRLFIKGLREKSGRGMRGAARRGTCVGGLPLGFTRCIARDQAGNAIYGRNGKELKERCIDPTSAEYRVLIYELYVERNWSPNKIARHFNNMRVDGWDGWTPSAIVGLLYNPSAIGVFIWNKSRSEYDLEAEKWVKVPNPRSEWEVFYDPALALIPMDVFRTTRRKLAAARRASPLTGRKPSRNQRSATTLFSGTLFCSYCGAELKLIRSNDRNKQMGCLNGINGAHQCELYTSKCTRIIEESLLTYLRDTLLTEDAIRAIWTKANEFVQRENEKPTINVAPLKAVVRKLEAAIKKLMARIENTDDDALCDVYDGRIKSLKKELNGQLALVSQAERQNTKRCRPLALDDVMRYFADLRNTLNQEVPMAAEAIRQLTGPITIRQELISGRKTGARWIATFSPDLARLLRHVCGNDGSLAALVACDASQASPIEVVIDNVPRYELRAPKFKELYDKGVSIDSIAATEGVSPQTVKASLKFANTGQRPKSPPKAKPNGSGRTRMKYKEVADEVVRLRDTEKWPFERICRELKIGAKTARRAYDYKRPDAVRTATEQGTAPNRGKDYRLSEESIREVRALLQKGVKVSQIAAQVGISTTSVYGIRNRMQNENEAA